MPRKRVTSVLCIFILAPGLLFSVLASRKTQNPIHDALLTPQTAALTINEYLADPAGSAAGDLAGDANGDGVRDAVDDEFVEIVNIGAAPLNVGLFTISDATQVRFTIPAGKVIPPGESAVVFGGGTPTDALIPRSCGAAGYASTLMTTRRFWARPAFVLFGAIGLSSP